MGVAALAHPAAPRLTPASPGQPGPTALRPPSGRPWRPPASPQALAALVIGWPGAGGAMEGTWPLPAGRIPPTPRLVLRPVPAVNPPSSRPFAPGSPGHSLEGLASDLQLTALIVALICLALSLGLRLPPLHRGLHRWLRGRRRQHRRRRRHRGQRPHTHPNGHHRGHGRRAEAEPLLPREPRLGASHHERLADPHYLEQILRAERDAAAEPGPPRRAPSPVEAPPPPPSSQD